MNRKFHWGIAALIIVLIAAGGFIYWQLSQIQQLKEQLAEDDKLLEGKDKEQHAVSKADEKPPDEPGFEWVRHGDHWDKVPFSEPKETPNVRPTPPPKTYDGPLTYHEELLKTNPVEALRLQTEERGHWSAEHIPPFPADDTEAQEFARAVYLMLYHNSHSPGGSPEQEKASKRWNSLLTEYDTRYPPESDDVQVRARNWDLTKLAWVLLPERIATDKQISEFPSEFTE